MFGGPALRCLKRLAVCAAIAGVLAAWQAAHWAGWWQAVRVTGDSMAPRLPGEHYAATCTDCGLELRCGIEHLPADRQLVCGNCGSAANPVSGEPIRGGQAVWIDRSLAARQPGRWDLVALAAPGDPQRLEVKRVVGLPGEAIEIRAGDLRVNGRPARKSLEQFQELAIQVHDDRCRPATAGLPPRWSAANAGTGWETAPGGYQFRPAASQVGTGRSPGALTGRRSIINVSGTTAGASPEHWVWLQYRHWPGMAAAFPPRRRTDETQIVDHYPYNQALTRSPLHPVTDLQLRLNVRTAGTGQLALRFQTASGTHEARWAPRRRSAELWRDGLLLRSAPVRVDHVRRSVPVEFTVWDHQAALRIAGQTVLWHMVEPDSEPKALETISAQASSPSGDPISGIQIGVTGPMAVQLDSLIILRDIFYLHPDGSGRPWPAAGSIQLPPDHYLLLGDNVPLSRDSRHWPSPAVHRKSLVGKVWHK
ncbi:MAG: hypothetical protein J5I93_15610 [Pirellulaceae bacterium]|nr:hypothetical protein [Pirellulaceae bacterium]